MRRVRVNRWGIDDSEVCIGDKDRWIGWLVVRAMVCALVERNGGREGWGQSSSRSVYLGCLKVTGVVIM